MNIIAQSAAVVVAIGTIGTGAYTLDQRHAPMSVVDDIGFQNITSLMNLVRELGSTPEGCKSLDEAVLKFCAKPKNVGNYLCKSDTIRDLKRRAGCDR